MSADAFRNEAGDDEEKEPSDDRHRPADAPPSTAGAPRTDVRISLQRIFSPAPTVELVVLLLMGEPVIHEEHRLLNHLWSKCWSSKGHQSSRGVRAAGAFMLYSSPTNTGPVTGLDFTI